MGKNTGASQLSVLGATGTRNDRVDTLLHSHLKLRVSVIATLGIKSLYNHAVMQIVIFYSYGYLILMLGFLGNRVSGRISIILQLLLDPLSEVIVIGKNHHLVVVVHVAKHELQVLFLPSDHLLAHLNRLLLRSRLFQELALPLVKAVNRVTASLQLHHVQSVHHQQARVVFRLLVGTSSDQRQVVFPLFLHSKGEDSSIVLMLVLLVFNLLGKFVELISVQKLPIFIHRGLHVDQGRLMRRLERIGIEVLLRVSVREAVL